MGAAANFVGKMILQIEKVQTEVPQKAGEKMLKESKDLVADATGQWYGSYAPRYYRRTYDLYNGIVAGSDASISGNVFTLKVDSDSVGQHSHDSGDYIFNGAFVNGIHGTSQIAVSTPPPDIYEPKLQELGEEKLQEVLDDYLASI